MQKPESKTIQFKSLVQANYLLRKGEPGGPVILLNHGFMSTNDRMWDRFAARIPEKYTLLAPNGPFPIPVREENSWKVGYSWFFYDNINKTFFIDYSICKDFMANLIENLGLSSAKKTIIGFSQGGYASVHMAESVSNVDHVIGLGCQFKIKNPNWSANIKVDGLHGDMDDLVDPKLAAHFFSELPEKARGRFETFPGVGHKPSVEMLDRAAQWALADLS